jgi:transcriptional regulator with XRE-family HTH domain
MFCIRFLAPAEYDSTWNITVMAVKIYLESIHELGRLVQYHRKQAQLSRIALADIAGIGKTALYDIEKGKDTVRLITLLKVLDALNISLELESPLMAPYKESKNAPS